MKDRMMRWGRAGREKEEQREQPTPAAQSSSRPKEAAGAAASDASPVLVRAPRRRSFEAFLLKDARVPAGHGLYERYAFAGREALRAVVRVIDRVLGAVGARAAAPLPDAEIALAGGAQFGKTLLELNLAAYLTSQQFRNFGLYLPDDDLVAGIVDSKFRPDVVDQIEWFAEMVQVGRGLNPSGRAVNRKGAFLVTDGRRKAVGMIRGLGKVPTTFSMDAAAMDEVDDIQPRMMKFVRGRLAASDLRLILKIGTQRIHGRGMHKAWKEGSQGVFTLKCPACGRVQVPEEEFPGIVRVKLNSEREVRSSESKVPQSARRAPRLTWAGDFRRDGKGEGHDAVTHAPVNEYYLGCVDCGAELDRSQPEELHRQPAAMARHKWSFRISQLTIAAIDLGQIVGRFQAAVSDAEEMEVFRCDVLGLPRSATQALTPAVLERARTVEEFDLSGRVSEGKVAYGGLDMGDCCWLFARETALPAASPGAAGGLGMRAGLEAGVPPPQRLLAVQKMAAADVVLQAQTSFQQLGLAALFIDERPLVNEARSLALALNGLQTLAEWPRITNEREACLHLPGGLVWDGRNARWHNLKCALVRFAKNRLGAGIEQTLVFFEEGGQTKFVPCLVCNRFETIDRVVREFLTPAEGVVEVCGGGKAAAVRQTPALLLPRLAPGHPSILDTLETHLLTGSERERDPEGGLGDYVSGCENHLLLADGYSALAAVSCRGNPGRAAAPHIAFSYNRRQEIVERMRDRRVMG